MLLLDTHVMLLWLADDARVVDAPIGGRIADPAERVVVSAASVWECSIKAALGKLDVQGDLVDALDRSQFARLAVTHEHAMAVAALPMRHRDPFDRLLVAQAQLEGLTLVTADEKIAAYEVDSLLI